MFFYNAMRYSARLLLARHGFESVTMHMAEDYAHYESMLERHNIRITRRVLLQELYALQHNGNSPHVLQRILEKPARRAPKRKPRRVATRPLRRALSDLSDTLEQIKYNQA